MLFMFCRRTVHKYTMDKFVVVAAVRERQLTTEYKSKYNFVS